MAVGAFPLAKLALLAMRQLSKPLANRLKTQAKNSPFFRKHVCMPPAQIYHWCEVNVKMRMLNLGKPSAVKPLKEAQAIELGAELLGEFIIFSVAAAGIVFEYARQAKNSRIEQDMREDRFHRLTHDMEDLQITVSRQEAEIRHLSRILGARHHQLVAETPVDPNARKEGSIYVSLEDAVTDAKAMMGKKNQTSDTTKTPNEDTKKTHNEDTKNSEKK